PVAYPCGLAPIRLNPDGDAEVVWADRIDPARAILRNVPYPSSGFRFGDLVLNDGAPTGYRMLSGREVPVFNCLELLERSSQSTFLAEIEMGEPSDIDLLARMADDRDMAAEDWSTSVRILCKACSEGLVHDQHDHNIPAVEGLHKVAVAGPDQHAVEGLLAAWREQSTSATILSIDLLLDAAAS
ncbi:MAG TPA: tetratricopeptide repeat protein, partial [Actinomycetota bacterium]|nr:tetratricopeptide repeat protein [Actinomycetota bacterium]